MWHDRCRPAKAQSVKHDFQESRNGGCRILFYFACAAHFFFCLFKRSRLQSRTRELYEGRGMKDAYSTVRLVANDKFKSRGLNSEVSLFAMKNGTKGFGLCRDIERPPWGLERGCENRYRALWDNCLFCYVGFKTRLKGHSFVPGLFLLYTSNTNDTEHRAGRLWLFMPSSRVWLGQPEQWHRVCRTLKE